VNPPLPTRKEKRSNSSLVTRTWCANHFSRHVYPWALPPDSRTWGNGSSSPLHPEGLEIPSCKGRTSLQSILSYAPLRFRTVSLNRRGSVNPCRGGTQKTRPADGNTTRISVAVHACGPLGRNFGSTKSDGRPCCAAQLWFDDRNYQEQPFQGWP